LEETWSIVKTSLAPIEVSAAAPPFARACGIPFPEAAAHLRTTRGVVIRGLSESVARSAAAALAAVGIACIAVEDHSTLPAPRPYFLRNASAASEAFVVHRETTGEVTRIPWADVRVIAAGQVVEKEMRKVTTGHQRRWTVLNTAIGLTTGIPIPARFGMVATTRTEEQSDVREYFDIVCSDPLQHYRIDGGRFNYSSMLPQPTPVAQANFCYMVGGLVRMATAAACNVLPEYIGADGSLSLEVFSDVYDYERLLTWLLTLHRLGIRVQDLPGSTGPEDRDRTVQMPPGASDAAS